MQASHCSIFMVILFCGCSSIGAAMLIMKCLFEDESGVAIKYVCQQNMFACVGCFGSFWHLVHIPLYEECETISLYYLYIEC